MERLGQIGPSSRGNNLYLSSSEEEKRTRRSEQGTKIERWDETENAAPQFAAGRSRETEGNEGAKALSGRTGLDDR